jgi:ATP synthase protein I
VSRSLPSLPAGQEQTLLALAAAMRRGVLAVAVAVGVPAVVVAGVVAGLPGALSALAGVVLAVAASLFTLWVMRRTAAREPKAVMIASMGGFIQKMIFLLVGLFLLGRVEGLHRMSLALAVIAVLIATTAAEGWAGYRLRTLIVDEPTTPATSGSPTVMSESTTSTPGEVSGRPGDGPPATDRGV